jgi:inosine-5'-monophosphate dehydrogenase
MAHDSIPYAYTFDDLLLLPGASAVLPGEVDLSTRLTRGITLSIPILSAAMDTVTEAETAISLARQGGIGILHRNMVVEAQALEVEKVKKSESGMILDPVTIGPREPIAKVLALMERYRISGIPVVEGRRLVGIVTNRDLRFETNLDLKVNEVMTKEDLVTAPVGITLEESKALLHQFRIEKLLVVDDDYNLKGLITIKDIEKIKKYPLACKDEFGRLRVGAAVGVGPDREERVDALVKAGADVIVIDTAHGHSERVLKAVEATKRKFPEVELVAGNAGTAEATRDLIKAGVDAVKVGVGPGSICTTRIIAGVGVPQLTAIFECSRAAREADIPIMADGGIKYSGRRHQGPGRRGRQRHDRQPLCRHRGVPGGNRDLPGPQLQDLPGHGLGGSHEGRQPGPLLPGRDRPGIQTGAGRHRGPGALPGQTVGPGLSVGGRGALRHGLRGRQYHPRTPGQGQIRAHQPRGLKGIPRPRRHHHEGSAELLGGLKLWQKMKPRLKMPSKPPWRCPIRAGAFLKCGNFAVISQVAGLEAGLDPTSSSAPNNRGRQDFPILPAPVRLMSSKGLVKKLLFSQTIGPAYTIADSFAPPTNASWPNKPTC